jgi:hypothetical protein
MIEDKTRRNFDSSSCSSISDPHLPAKCGDRWTQEDINARNIINYFLPTDRPTPGGGGPESPYLIRVALPVGCRSNIIATAAAVFCLPRFR